MNLNIALTQMTYGSIVKFVSSQPDEKKIKQLRIFYSELLSKNVPYSVINATLLLALRINKGLIPANKYLHDTFNDNFKYCKNEHDAVKVLTERLQYEENKREIKAEKKKVYQGKQSMTTAAYNLTRKGVI